MMLRTVIRITDGFFSFLGRRSVTSVRLTSSPSRQASAAASRVMSTNTATTSSSVKDQERWMTLRENTFPTVSTRISSVEITRTIFSTAASAFMIFLQIFMLSTPLKKFAAVFRNLEQIQGRWNVMVIICNQLHFSSVVNFVVCEKQKQCFGFRSTAWKRKYVSCVRAFLCYRNIME